MRVSCFTFIRNGTRLGYPYTESIRSALPLCDEFIVVVGDSEDDTRERVAAIGDRRIRIIDSVWNPKVTEKGYVLAQQKMIGQFNCTGDWAFYIEGDEILHEDDVATVRGAMERHLDNPSVEALYFDYLHFFGGVAWVGAGHSFYRQEARIIRNSLRVFTTDALYFLVLDRKKGGRYPRAAATGAPLYHYGNARASSFMTAKRSATAKLYRDSAALPKRAEGESVYGMDRRLLRPFEGTHPAIMKEWIATSAETAFVPREKPQLPSRQQRNLWGLKIEEVLPVDFSKRHFTRAKV